MVFVNAYLTKFNRIGKVYITDCKWVNKIILRISVCYVIFRNLSSENYLDFTVTLYNQQLITLIHMHN